MNPDRHGRLTRWFLEAVDLDPVERTALLERLEKEDPALRSELEVLLQEESREVPPILEPGRVVDLWPKEPRFAPGRIGGYQILDRLGEGGMGIVYRAAQDDPIRRTVALKVIKPGLETEKVLSRFESERQALSMLSHPNIARVYDAGTTTSGRPYFTMEFVEGESITTFCDRRGLGVEDRIRLFVRVCEAVHHAHQNAILHRDIKPSNVLVDTEGGAPVPKVIDFGIAKALATDGRGGTPLTEDGQIIGTPEYMSPEQAVLSPANLDVRSDVYSLGALLYELLVGDPPFDPEELRRLDLAQMQQHIRSHEPERPSVRAGRISPRARRAASARRADPAALRRRLRGDLDDIVLKSLEKDRDQRYGSASDLAGDLRRYLAHEPISVARPSVLYRLAKLTRKHRLVSATVATAIPVLVSFGVVLALQAREVARERDRAEEVTEFLVRFYEVPFFVSGRHSPPDAVTILQQTARKAESELGDRPVLQARLLHSLGEALRGIGEAAVAEPILERARLGLRATLGDEDPITLSAEHDLARIHLDLHRPDRAESALRDNLRMRRKVLGTDHPDTLRTASSLAYLLKVTGRHRESAALYELALDGMNRSLGPDAQETLITASLLASEYLEVHSLDEAEQLIREILPKLDETQAERMMAFYNLGCVLALKGERDGALRALRSAADAGFGIRYIADPHLRHLLDDPEFIRIAKGALLNDPRTLRYVDAKARLLVAEGRQRDAEAIYRYMADELPAEELDVVVPVRRRLADLYLSEERFEEARSAVTEHLGWMRVDGSETREALAAALWVLAQAQIAVGTREEATAALDDLIAVYAEDPPQLGRVAYARAARESVQGNRSAAIRYLREAADHGFWQLDLIVHDRALAALREVPEVESIISRIAWRSEYR